VSVRPCRDEPQRQSSPHFLASHLRTRGRYRHNRRAAVRVRVVNGRDEAGAAGAHSFFGFLGVAVYTLR
jgi:hypothetical protein